MIKYNLEQPIKYENQDITQLALYPLTFRTLSVRAKIKEQTNMFLVKMSNSYNLSEEDKKEARKQNKLVKQAEKTLEEKVEDAKSYIELGLDSSFIFSLLMKHELIKIAIPNTEAVVIAKEVNFEDLNPKDAEELVVTYLANFM